MKKFSLNKKSGEKMNNKGISICITSAKGGVGKTITTLNLAGLYEILEKKVLIIDFDLSSGGIATALNVNVQKTVYNLVDDYNNNRYQDFKNYIAKYDEYIDILPSPKDPRQANKINIKYIELIIDKAIYNYDIVLIDTSHILNDFNISTLDLVDKVLFLVTNDPLDLKNMRNIINILKTINYDKYKVILNESIAPFKKYFSLYDIKNIINTNIDYIISKDFYIKNIDSIVMNGRILTLDNKISTMFIISDYEIFKDKKLLDKLRTEIVENLIDRKMPNDTTLNEWINDLIDETIEGYDLTNLERSHLYNLIDNEINGYGPISELLEDDKDYNKIFAR